VKEMKMNVPTDLKYLNNSDKTCIEGVYVKKYTESMDSKIYTHLEENLLVFVLKGSKSIKANSFSKKVIENNFIFLKKDNVVMNQIIDYKEKSYQSLLIFINNEYIKEIIEIFNKDKITNNITNDDYFYGQVNENIKNEVQKILLLLDNSNDYTNEIIKLKVKELLIYIAQNDKSKKFIALLKSAIDNKDDFQKFIEENYDKYNGIKEFADKYSVSISAFKRKFNSFYSTTPAKWIRDKKLEKASKLLIGTDYSITEISHISGFESLSSFNLCFKNKYGLAPTEYRKMN
jgi:AraC-like DNA-binding protein